MRKEKIFFFKILYLYVFCCFIIVQFFIHFFPVSFNKNDKRKIGLSSLGKICFPFKLEVESKFLF